MIKKIKDILPGSIAITFVCLLVYSLIINPLMDTIYLNTDFAYAITDNVSTGSVGSTGAENTYIFFLNGHQYVGRTRLPLRKDGTKYFIKYYPKNPRINKATRVVATPEDIKNLPPGGYKKLPHE